MNIAVRRVIIFIITALSEKCYITKDFNAELLTHVHAHARAALSEFQRLHISIVWPLWWDLQQMQIKPCFSLLMSRHDALCSTNTNIANARRTYTYTQGQSGGLGETGGKHAQQLRLPSYKISENISIRGNARGCPEATDWRKEHQIFEKTNTRKPKKKQTHSHYEATCAHTSGWALDICDKWWHEACAHLVSWDGEKKSCRGSPVLMLTPKLSV